MTNFKGGDWEEWANHVFAEMKRFDTEISNLKDRDLDSIKKDIQEIKLEIGTLKVKLAIWGGIAVFLATMIAQIGFKFIK